MKPTFDRKIEIKTMNQVTENAVSRKDQRGQSLIEIALITPLLLIALYVPMDFGIGLFMAHLTQNAVREGARIGTGLQKTGGGTPPFSFSSTEANTVKRSEEHTSELQSRRDLVCRLLLEKKKQNKQY